MKLIIDKTDDKILYTFHNLALSFAVGISKCSTNFNLLNNALSMLSMRLVVNMMIPGNRSI